VGKIQDDDPFMKVALIAGATGLIGSQLLQRLLGSDRYHTVMALTRKDLPVHSKLVSLKMDRTTLENMDSTMRIDDVFCCLGTTMAKANSKERFYEVDFTYPLLLAKNSLRQGAQQYLLVSALGANTKSPIYYNGVKGEIEDAISHIGFKTVHIFRPSLLLGPRDESRPGEDAAKFFYKVFGFIIPAKYKAVESIKVARAMLQYASREEIGTFVHESRELQNF
jgi:uncharacterized protein YbjT (DUF2867 family)